MGPSRLSGRLINYCKTVVNFTSSDASRKFKNIIDVRTRLVCGGKMFFALRYYFKVTESHFRDKFKPWFQPGCVGDSENSSS